VFLEAYGFVSPEFIPESLRCIEGDGIGYFSGVQGLFVASGESYPSLGSFGGTVAAIEATTEYAQWAGVADGMKTDGQWGFIE